MAGQNWAALMMLEAQAARGTIAPTLDAFNFATTQPTLADGLVLGDAGSGEGESGIDSTVTRRLSEKAFVSGSFTRPFSDFLAEDFDTLTFAFPFCGNRRTTTVPVDADFRYEGGIEGILRACGLQREAWSGGVGERFFPGNVSIDGSEGAYASCRLLYEGQDWHLRDLVGDLTITWTPGEIPVASAAFPGAIVDSFTGAAFPSGAQAPDYEEQASVSAIIVESAANFFGHGDTGATSDVVRGFSSLELAISNSIEDVPDSNQTGGITKEQTGREVVCRVTLFQDSDDPDYLRQRLIAQVAGTDKLQFQIGTAAGAAATALAHRIVLTNPTVGKITPRKVGGSQAWECELRVIDNVANGELDLILL